MEMKKSSWIIIVIATILAILAVAFIADYYLLENQILRDIDEYNEKGHDPEIGSQIINKIGLMGADGKERLNSFIKKNPKVNDFLGEWAKTHSWFSASSKVAIAFLNIVATIWILVFR